MVADKRVQISCGDKQIEFHRVTEVKISEELDSDLTKTFDEPVTVPSSEGGFTVDIDALEARNVDEFYNLKTILKRMKTTPGNISVYETVKHRDGNFEVENHLGGVSLTSNEVTYNAEDLTARSLSFNAESCREVIDGRTVE